MLISLDKNGDLYRIAASKGSIDINATPRQQIISFVTLNAVSAGTRANLSTRNGKRDERANMDVLAKVGAEVPTSARTAYLGGDD